MKITLFIFLNVLAAGCAWIGGYFHGIKAGERAGALDADKFHRAIVIRQQTAEKIHEAAKPQPGQVSIFPLSDLEFGRAKK